MKKTLMVLFVAMVVFSTVYAFAAEEKAFAAEEKIAAATEEEAKWTPTAEASVAWHSAYINEASGGMLYRKAVSTQSAMVGIDRDGVVGFYVQGENFIPFDDRENEETDFYVGFYAEIADMKFDVGYARYWVRESGELDFNAVYAAVDFPAAVWGIVPFVKMEYDFAKKTEEGENMNGFMYFAGVKREFSLHERVKILAEVGVGGNTGLYGMPVENLAYAREKVEVSISILEWLKLKGTAMTQQNLSHQEGIAEDTSRLFVSTAIVATF